MVLFTLHLQGPGNKSTATVADMATGLGCTFQPGGYQDTLARILQWYIWYLEYLTQVRLFSECEDTYAWRTKIQSGLIVMLLFILSVFIKLAKPISH